MMDGTLPPTLFDLLEQNTAEFYTSLQDPNFFVNARPRNIELIVIPVQVLHILCDIMLNVFFFPQ